MKSRKTGAWDYLAKMKAFRVLKEPVIKQVMESLMLPAGSKSLDVGCGDGYYTLMLAESLGPGSHVNGIDAVDPFLDQGRTLSSKFNLTERDSFIKGVIEDLRLKKTFLIGSSALTVPNCSHKIPPRSHFQGSTLSKAE